VKGNYPAVETLNVIMVRQIMRRRQAAGLSQVELAKRAGVRPETLNRIEKGKHTPSLGTITRVEQALTAAETQDEARSQH
jgi:transcriptional regulator with XRE-family HTH domain